jgi:hypothetical protein
MMNRLGNAKNPYRHPALMAIIKENYIKATALAEPEKADRATEKKPE